MAFPNANPTTTTVSLPVYGPRGLVATGSFAVDLWEMTALATVSCPALALPAGRWLVSVTLSAVGAGAPEPVTYQGDTGQIGAGNTTVPTQQMRLYRPLDGATVSVYAAIDVKQWDGTRWVPYATSWHAGTAAVSPYVVATAPAVSGGGYPHWSAALHLIIPSWAGGTWWDKAVSEAAALGVGALRVAVPWHLCQPVTPGTFTAQWGAALDTIVAKCAAASIKLIVGTPAYPPAARASNATEGGPLTSWADYDTVLDSVVARIGAANILAFEGWNEPNAGDGSGSAAASFTALGRTVAELVTESQHINTRVKAASAAIKCIGPGLAFGDKEFLQVLYTAGIGAYIDGVNIHPYPVRFSGEGIAARFGAASGTAGMLMRDASLPWGDVGLGDERHPLSAVQVIHETMRANGQGTSGIWLTEFGWATSFTAAGGGMQSSDTGEAQQAANLRTVLRQLARVPYVENVGFYALDDTSGTPTDASDGRVMSEQNPGTWNGAGSEWGVTSQRARYRKASFATVASAIAGGGA